MTKFERGIVKFFDSRKDKQFGFILLPSQEEVFFHFNDGGPVVVGLETPSIQTYGRTREPGKGDVLLFERSRNRKGSKAAPWCFAADWERAQQEIAARPVYRLIKQTGEFRFTRDPQVVWEGTNLDELRARFGGVKLGYAYKGGTGGTEKFWFEEKTAEGWQRVENDCDPRKIPLNLGRLAKPKMPLEIARRILATAKRNALIDDAFGDSEVHWMAKTKTVAEAYTRLSGATVVTEETDEYDVTKFNRDESKELVELGLSGKVEQNDAGDPREVDGIHHGSYEHEW